MSNLKLIFDDLTPQGTLTTTATTETNLPVTNLAVADRSQVMRTTTLADFAIKENFTTDQFASGFSLRDYNAQADATIRVRLFSGENQTGTTEYDSGTVSILQIIPWGIFEWGVDLWGDSYADGDFFILWFDAVKFKSLQVDISDTTNTDGYIEIGRMFYGLSISSSFNMAYGLSFGFNENTTQTRTSAGTLRANNNTPYKRESFNLQWLSDLEKLRFLKQMKITGKHKDVLVSLYPDEDYDYMQTHTLIGKLKEVPQFSHDYYNLNSTTFNIEES